MARENVIQFRSALSEEPKNRIERSIATLAIGLLAVPQSAVFLTDRIWPLVSALDPDNVFLWISIHHLLELVFTVLVMQFVFRKNLHQWGWNLNKWRESLRIFGWFVLFYLGWSILTRLDEIVSGTAPFFGYPLTAKNIAGNLGFRILLNGTAEEALFRGLVMIVLVKYWRGTYRIGNVEIPSVGIVATIFFMLGHINFTVSPLAVTHFSLYQQFLSFSLGLFYAIVFYRTGSLLGPILMHSYSNTIAVTVLYSMAFLFR